MTKTGRGGLKVLYRSHKRGFVLISVLMLGVLLISCATSFSWFVRMQVRGMRRETISLSKRTLASVLANSVMSLLSEASSHTNYDSPVQ